MKAKLFDRILLALLLILLALLGIFFVLLSVKVFSLESIQYFVHILFTVQQNVIILGACGLIIFIIALRLLFAGSGPAKTKEVTPTSTLIKASDIGASFITLSALDSMVQKHCRSINRIRNAVSTVTPARDGGVTVSVRLALMPDTEIPELTVELQRTMKEYIEKFSGITVREIGVLIEDTSSTPKGRVE